MSHGKGSSQPHSRASHPVLLAVAGALSCSSQNSLPLSLQCHLWSEGSISGTPGVLKGQSLQVTYGKLPRAMRCLLPGAQQARATPAPACGSWAEPRGLGSGWQAGRLAHHRASLCWLPAARPSTRPLTHSGCQEEEDLRITACPCHSHWLWA